MTTMHVPMISAPLKMELNTFQSLAITETNALLDLATEFWDANIPAKFVMMIIFALLILVQTEFVSSLLLYAKLKTARLYLAILNLENASMLMLTAMIKMLAPSILAIVTLETVSILLLLVLMETNAQKNLATELRDVNILQLFVMIKIFAPWILAILA
jgi:hypothetical protein